MFQRNILLRQITRYYLDEVIQEMPQKLTPSYTVRRNSFTISLSGIGSITSTWSRRDDFFDTSLQEKVELDLPYGGQNTSEDDVMTLHSGLHYVSRKIQYFMSRVERMESLYKHNIISLSSEPSSSINYLHEQNTFYIRDENNGTLEASFLSGVSRQRGASPQLDYLNRSFQNLVQLLKSEWDKEVWI